MNRLRATFGRLRQQRRKALIPFIMGGDPNLETTVELLAALSQAGADVLEVGIPFSDPLADGPIIQRASARALACGMTPERILNAIRRASGRFAAPIVLLSYWNLILQYGRRPGAQTDPGRFIRAAIQSGISGVVVPDLPVEEAGAFRMLAHREGLATVFLAAPTSPAHRLRHIARASEGFIYYVSVTGTTGVRNQLPADWLHGVRQLRLMTTKPICVGFGISTPAQASAIARVADGVIVGSALLRRMEPHLKSKRRLIAQACAFTKQLREAV